MLRKEFQAPLRDPVRWVKTSAIGKSELWVGIDLSDRPVETVTVEWPPCQAFAAGASRVVEEAGDVDWPRLLEDSN